MPAIGKLLENNRRWSRQMLEASPHFFEGLAQIQAPKFLWIGCADSRVPSSQITGTTPGQIFTHRNVANVVVHTDLNCLSVLHYAVEVLKVEHVIVCGHYGCGGVQAAMNGARLGLVDNWLRHIRDVHLKHALRIEEQPPARRFDALCELNVIEQCMNVCQTTIVQDAWTRGQALGVHGWIYGLKDGLINDLGFHAQRPEDTTPSYGNAVAGVRKRASAEV
jgi:carbonic anhydrase